MPISRDVMESEGAEVTKIRSNKKKQVIELLAEKNEEDGYDAYTQGEVAKAMGIKPQHARSILVDLVDAGICKRKQVQTGTRTLIYFTLTEDFLANKVEA